MVRHQDEWSWRDSGIALAVVAVWVLVAVALEKITGHDGLRMSGWVFVLLGLGAGLWYWRKKGWEAGGIALLCLSGFGLFIAFGRF